MNQKDKNTILYESLQLTGEQRALFDQLMLLLTEKNSQVNLTAITDPEEIRDKHFADSLAICLCKEAAEKLRKGAKVLDLGTGGGFPALPIKIVYPDADIMMLDATTPSQWIDVLQFGSIRENTKEGNRDYYALIRVAETEEGKDGAEVSTKVVHLKAGDKAMMIEEIADVINM